MTVRGWMPAANAGIVLPHEHLFSSFGLDAAPRHAYDLPRLRGTVGPYLRYLKELGCGTIMDCTTAWFGRDVALLREFSDASGVNVVANTGYYGAADDRYVPPHSREESAEQLARRWIAEWRDGIDGSRVRPGLIKTAVDSGPLSPIDRKLVTAAALTHRETGLTISCHTSDNPGAAAEQLEVLKAEGVSPEAWVWVHAHNVKDVDALERAAATGAWIELDGLDPSSLDLHLERLLELRRRGLLGRLLVSHDGDFFPAPPSAPRPADALLTTFRYTLLENGLDEAEVRRLIEENPVQAFAVRVRS
jgi:phosphotriesterase-related protein